MQNSASEKAKSVNREEDAASAMSARKTTLLVVEDDENDIFLFRHAFDKAGLPHLLLLDLKTPKMEGVSKWMG